MRKISCIAIDDEPIALTIIARFCERHGDLTLTTFSDPHVGMDAILQNKPDIVFLDIEMKSLNGLQIARTLPPACCVIFTTAFTEYALEGFDLNAVDFLHKPFSYERFATSVERALRRLDFVRNHEQTRTIIVKQEYDSIPIPISDILYIEAMENYVKIYRESGTRIISRISLKSIINMLPQDEFVRIHRSYVVAKAKIVRFSKRRVQLSPDIELPVGQLYLRSSNDTP